MPSIASEGHLPIIICACIAAAGGVGVGLFWWLPGAIALLTVAYLFRVPSTIQPDSPLAVVSPLGGEVLEVGPTYDPWLRRNAIRIAIAVPMPGVGVIFNPVSGKIAQHWTDLPILSQVDVPQSDVEEWFETLLESPSRYVQAIFTDTDDEVVYAVSSARRHSRLKFDQAPGEWAARCRRSGFVFGASRVDLLLPSNASPRVEVGDTVGAGSSIVADLFHDL
ncbi:MAG: phosphatidylserine decarboxylase [Gammaproteobacteria bacterium]